MQVSIWCIWQISFCWEVMMVSRMGTSSGQMQYFRVVSDMAIAP